MVGKRRQIIIIAVFLMVMVSVGITSTVLYNKNAYSSQGGTNAGIRVAIGMQPFWSEFGVYVHYEVYSLDSRPLDVFLVTYDELQNYLFNGTFTYFPQGSAENITVLDLQVTLDNSNELYSLIIMSNASNTSVPFGLSWEQAPFPLPLSGVLDVLIQVSWLSATVLFVLLVAMVWKKKDRNEK